MRSKVFFLLIPVSILFGILLMVLESIKNMLLIVNPIEPIIVEAPLIGLQYSISFVWDLAMIMLIVTYILGVGLAYGVATERE